MPLQQYDVMQLSSEFPILIEELGNIVSEDVLEMRKPNRCLYGTVHYFRSAALDDMLTVIELKNELEGIASAAGTPVVISMEVYLRSQRIWRLRIDRVPSSL